MQLGDLREDLVLEPVSGKAIPLAKGETMRILQEQGGQCVDFNCFSLHDYKEHMSVGHMRRQGFRIAKGDYIFSAPPRSNLMMLIAEMPESCVTDLLGSRCSAELFEATWGVHHTNCQDTLAESIGEFGLTPDDTHDSFNMWMNTGWDDRGRWEIRRNSGKQGDFVDLLALMDVLAVPVVCGSGDVTGVSNYSLRPIRVQVFGASPETEQVVTDLGSRFGGLRHRATPSDFRVSQIRTERSLQKVADYEPRFVNFPLQFETFQVDLTAGDRAAIERIKAQGLADDDEDAIRTAVFSWYTANRSEPNPFASP
jgi:uncharacterized protein YcgI (DUF1989 family)